MRFLSKIACGIAAALAITLTLLSASPAPAEDVARQAAELRFASGNFRPEGPAPIAPAWYRDLAEERSARGRRYLVAIASGPLDPDQRRQLEQAGASVLGYIPDHGYRVRIDPAAVDSVGALPFLVWLGEPPRHFKVQAELAAHGPATAR